MVNRNKTVSTHLAAAALPETLRSMVVSPSRTTVLILFTAVLSGKLLAAEPASLDMYNPVWDSASADARGSMPIGNGDIGLNVWVEPSGDLCFFIGKTDAWDENARLIKLGKVRVKFNPALDTMVNFRWELKLRDGAIEISDGKVQARVWVDANHSIVQVDAKSLSGDPIAVTATLEPWRKEKRPLGGGMHGEYFATGFTSRPAFSYPDTILPRSAKRIGWYHRNVDSPWLPSLKLQKIEEIAKTHTDPILNRTMGGLLRGDGFVAETNTTLKTGEPATEFSLRVHILTQITDTPEQWLAALEKQADAVDDLPVAQRWAAHTRWWNEFWNRSWIFVEVGGSLALPVNPHPWRFGVDSNGGNKFGGEIADPHVIGRALSVEDIASLIGEPRRLPPPPVAGEIPALQAENIGNGCTVAAWIKPVARDAGRILDKCTVGRADGFLLDTHPGLALRWTVGPHTMIHPNCLKADEWQHVAATADTTGTRRIYLNGKLVREERDESAETITRGYLLQRWINACGGRGAFPIKFNGSIFGVDTHYDADYRHWGGGYWFQNTRLPYWSMLAAGDYDLMPPLFEMYLKALPARKLATQTYYKHAGAFFPETMTFWGNYLDQGSLGYGINRSGKPDGLTDNQYVRREWQGGIELVAMMLDYYEHTRDAAFRDSTLLPFATEIIAFFDQHWPRGDDGRIRMNPSQALETWWNCTNPMPEVAGLHFVLPQLIELTRSVEQKDAWRKTLNDLPPIPTGEADGKRFLLPAEEFASRHNTETPELYAVFPFRLYGLGEPGLAVALNTWPRRHPKGTGGWYQDAIHAARLGLTDEARQYVTANFRRTASGFRFQAMWGPNFNWVPDQDHGGVTLIALQMMLLQSNGDKILLLPAWPKDWNVSFKLHAPQNTTVEGVYRNGTMEELKVTPESRRKDVVTHL